jgi:hypothetical protein
MPDARFVSVRPAGSDDQKRLRACQPTFDPAAGGREVRCGRALTEDAVDVPLSLRRWFVVHFVADLLFAVPLIVAPVATLRALGWTAIDPIAARLVAAALAGIGIQSLIGRNEPVDAFRAMLRLKCIWSGVAVLGLAISVAEGAPPITWAFLAIFAGFAVVWNYYRLRLRIR